MANKVIQYRYYGQGNTNNYPLNISANLFSNGTIFEDTTPILQLGIQTMPGAKFYLNKSSEDPIIIGSTGIYELDLQNKTEITHLRFAQDLLDNIDSVNNSNNGQYNPNAYLIVDIIYEQMEVE